jgi:hypothetical protein
MERKDNIGYSAAADRTVITMNTVSDIKDYSSGDISKIE